MSTVWAIERHKHEYYISNPTLPSASDLKTRLQNRGNKFSFVAIQYKICLGSLKNAATNYSQHCTSKQSLLFQGFHSLNHTKG